MLILTRKLNEAIQIGDNVRLKVLHISDGQVKIGIEAPTEVKIFRAEIYAEIQKQNLLAAQVDKSAAAKAASVLTKSTTTPNIE
jgi:carbon storage regulator